MDEQEIQRHKIDALEDELYSLKLRCDLYEGVAVCIIDYIMQTVSDEQRSLLEVPNEPEEIMALLISMKIDREGLSIAREIRGD